MKIEKAIEVLKEQYITVSKCLFAEEATERNNAISLAIQALEEKLNGGWIPVSERLPEKEDIYQVTIKYKNFAGIHLTVRTAIYENKKWNIHGPQPVISNIKIIAWQPLPEPYKEEENE